MSEISLERQQKLENRMAQVVRNIMEFYHLELTMFDPLFEAYRHGAADMIKEIQEGRKQAQKQEAINPEDIPF